MTQYEVVLASGAEHLQDRFSELGYGVHCCGLNYDGRRMFPNADIYAIVPDIEELSGKRVVVVQSCTGSGPAEKERYTTSDRVVELLLLLDVLRRPTKVEEVGHKQYKETPIPPPARVEVVLTFQPFALQDKSFKTGEAASGRWAMETIAASCDKVWTVNPHAPSSLQWVKKLAQSGKYAEIDIISDLVDFAKRHFGYDNCLVVTPDEGGQERFSVAGFGKSRHNSYSVELHGELVVGGCNVVVIDDLTKSGSTLLKASERLKAQGACGVGMAVVHVLPLADKGEELLERLVEKSGGMIVTSNTVPTRIFGLKNPQLVYNVVDSIVKAV
ncbi:MAG: hypothetical protein HXY34_13890 [Candidatus Thorarchaeota archaeon]|nr:hypothetical protein [Candidatus Thorarchaeota archaeon]